MKFRVIVNGVHFFTTTKAIRNGVGDQYATNAALQKALLCLNTPVSFAKSNGIAGTWEGMSVQLDRI
jgi:hypothetical protein